MLFEIKTKLANDIASSLNFIEDICSVGDGYNLTELTDEDLMLLSYSLGLVVEILKQEK